MTDDDKSLVERLREGVLYGDARLHNPKGHDPLRMEAADRIEALESQVRAADALAEQVQRVKDFRYDPNIGIELNRLEDALTAYRATKEGGE